MDLTLVPYQQDGLLHVSSSKPISYVVKYKECMKNHAASIGGHANDGCGEFMPRSTSDDDDTSTNNSLNSLTCAACGCHRNFHRKEDTATSSSPITNLRQQQQPPPPLHFEHLMLCPPPLQGVTIVKKHMNMMSSSHDDHEDDDDHDRRSDETPERGEVNYNHVGMSGGGGGLLIRTKSKRFRTKFTQEQKDRMLEFAERIGWRINKNDDMALNQLCNEIGVKRNVLKVWMHNNKNAHRRREVQEPSTVAAPSPPRPSVAPQAVGV